MKCCCIIWNVAAFCEMLLCFDLQGHCICIIYTLTMKTGCAGEYHSFGLDWIKVKKGHHVFCCLVVHWSSLGHKHNICIIQRSVTCCVYIHPWILLLSLYYYSLYYLHLHQSDKRRKQGSHVYTSSREAHATIWKSCPRCAWLLEILYVVSSRPVEDFSKA